MESVNFFNAELSSLYDVKPPISKGKMTSITKAALKAVKLYKHVVQSVEKFIQKCKPEYKIPGLYVIDSIIRQSRHQFGAEKDIFAGRFLRNLQTTFVYLYKCPEEDKSKVIRVLNLWQKNKIFLPEAIQPLFDLADPTNPIWETIQLPQDGIGGNDSQYSQPSLTNQSNDQHPVHFKKELLDYDYDEDEEGGGENNMSSVVPAPPLPQPGIPTQMPQNALSGFDALGSILTNPEVLRQLQTLQEQMAAASQQHHQIGYLTPEQERQRKLAELKKQEAAFDQRLAQTVARLPFAVECDLPFADSNESKSPKLEPNSAGLLHHEHNQQNAGLLLPPPFFHQLNAEQLQQMLPSSNSNDLRQQLNDNQPQMPNPFGIPLNFPLQAAPQMNYQQLQPQSQQNSDQFNNHQNPLGFSGPFNPEQPPGFDYSNFNEDIGRDSHRDRERRDRGSRTSERSRVRTRSRSGSNSRRSSSRQRRGKRHMRSRSRSRDRREEKEREKERQRKGLPSIKKGHLSICSTTLWVGHLSKLVNQEEISDTFGSYGDVVSIDLISSRGCAFVVMNRRQDACRALDRLKGTKLQGKSITLAWAPGKGVKGRDWKDYWEVEAGVSYIPLTRLKPDTNLEEFEDGGSIDEDSLPDFLKNSYREMNSKDEKKEEQNESNSNNCKEEPTSVISNNISSTIIAPLIMGLNSDSQKSGDIDGRLQPEMPSTQPSLMNQVGQPPMTSPFAPGSLMNSMAMNMLIPPPMMGSTMCLPPQFQGLNSLPPGINMPSLMGILPQNMARMPQDTSGLNQMGVVPGLLGEMPMPQQLNVQSTNNNSIDNEDSRKRRPGDRRENREKKKSRFDDADDRSPARNLDEHSPSNFEIGKDGQPLFERLKSMAGGYAFGGPVNNEKIGLPNSLLGTPIGPGPGLPQLGGMGPLDARMPDPHSFPNSLPRHPGQFNSPRGPSFPGERQVGPGGRPWFDGSQNPFMHQNSPNPFSGNPFMQQVGENPFELSGAQRGGGGGLDRGGRGGQFFGGPEPGHFGQRGGGRGWPRGDGPPPNNWRGPMRGRGAGPGRGGPNWRGGRNQEDDLGFREIDRERDGGRGFRGGRGRDNRDRGNDYDRDNDRRRGWGRDRDPPNRDRERDRERNRSGSRENNNARSLSSSEDRAKNNARGYVGFVEETWESVPYTNHVSERPKSGPEIGEENWESEEKSTDNEIKTEKPDDEETPFNENIVKHENDIQVNRSEDNGSNTSCIPKVEQSNPEYGTESWNPEENSNSNSGIVHPDISYNDNRRESDGGNNNGNSPHEFISQSPNEKNWENEENKVDSFESENLNYENNNPKFPQHEMDDQESEILEPFPPYERPETDMPEINPKFKYENPREEPNEERWNSEENPDSIVEPEPEPENEHLSPVEEKCES